MAAGAGCFTTTPIHAHSKKGARISPTRTTRNTGLGPAFISADTTPLDVQARSLEIPTCYAPQVELEELDRDELASASSLRTPAVRRLEAGERGACGRPQHKRRASHRGLT